MTNRNWLLARRRRLQTAQEDVLRRFGARPVAGLAGAFLSALLVLTGFIFWRVVADPAGAGSPVAALSTSPPPSFAICDRRRLEIAERGFSWAISALDAKSSRCLINNQDVFVLLPKPRVRTSAHEPFSFLPCSVNFKSPFSSAAATSGLSADQVPLSQTITVPPPYSPSGITPSKLAYSTG